jgi:hypothetical protein
MSTELCLCGHPWAQHTTPVLPGSTVPTCKVFDCALEQQRFGPGDKKLNQLVVAVAAKAREYAAAPAEKTLEELAALLEKARARAAKVSA